MNIKKSLQSIDASGSNFYFNDVDVIPENINAVLINEVVPKDPENDFYGKQDGEYLYVPDFDVCPKI